MRTFLLIILTVLSITNVSGQASFSPIDSKLETQKVNILTELICSSSTMSVKFQLMGIVTVLQHNNFATVDSQTIQIIPLKFSDFKKNPNGQSMIDQKQLLEAYSRYELDYFINELGVEVLNPNSQWVMTESRGWFIWYFRVGKLTIQVDNQTTIQLFASTVIDDKILTLNAPIQSDKDFNKAALIINEMMESIIVTMQ